MRVSKTDASGNSAYAYDANNRLTSAGSSTFTYDPNGSLISRVDAAGPTTTYQYDALKRLTQVSSGGATTSYAYDAGGNRVRKQDPSGAITNYLVDPFATAGLPQVLRETDATGADVADYVAAGRLLLSGQRAAVGPAFYLTDGTASTRLLTDASGAITDRYDYDAFGNLTSAQGSSTNAYRYTGQQFDASDGLYYLRARYYDPSVGRFLTTDPVTGTKADPRSLNAYMYSLNDPIDRMDPSGRQSLSDVSIAMAISSFLDEIEINIGFAFMDQIQYGGSAGMKTFFIGIVTAGLIGAAMIIGPRLWRGTMRVLSEIGSEEEEGLAELGNVGYGGVGGGVDPGDAVTIPPPAGGGTGDAATIPPPPGGAGGAAAGGGLAGGLPPWMNMNYLRSLSRFDGTTLINQYVEEYARIQPKVSNPSYYWSRNQQFLPEFEETLRRLSQSEDGIRQMRAANIINQQVLFTQAVDNTASAAGAQQFNMAMGLDSLLDQYSEVALPSLSGGLEAPDGGTVRTAFNALGP